MKTNLKDECPKDILFEFGLSENSELSEYFSVYVKTLKEKWKQIKELLEEKYVSKKCVRKLFK